MGQIRTTGIILSLTVGLAACSGGSSSGASVDGGGQASDALRSTQAADTANQTADVLDVSQDSDSAQDAAVEQVADALADTSVGSCLGVQGSTKCPTLGATCQDGVTVCNGVSKPQTACSCVANDPQSPQQGYWLCEVNDCFAPDVAGGGGVPGAADATSGTD